MNDLVEQELIQLLSRAWSYRDIITEAKEVITQLGWNISPSVMMGEDGSVDLNGAFACALGIILEPGPNNDAYDILEAFFKHHKPFRVVLLSTLLAENDRYPDTARVVGELVRMSNKIGSSEEACGYIDYLLDLAEARGLS